MGKVTPPGYDVKERRLVVNQKETETLRHISALSRAAPFAS